MSQLLPLLTCAACGVLDIPRLEAGPGPGEYRKAVCAHCGHYLKWLPKAPPQHEESGLMESLNIVALTGVLETEPAIRWEPDSSLARCTCRLRCEEVHATGSTFRLYVPLEAWGKTAEALGELHAGALVAIQGKLVWRKSPTKQALTQHSCHQPQTRTSRSTCEQLTLSPLWPDSGRRCAD